MATAPPLRSRKQPTMFPVRRLRTITVAALSVGLAVAPAAASAKGTHGKAKHQRAGVTCSLGAHHAAAKVDDTKVVIVSTVSRSTGDEVSTTSTAYRCGATGTWQKIADPMAAVDLIPTSTVIERTERV